MEAMNEYYTFRENNKIWIKDDDNFIFYVQSFSAISVALTTHLTPLGSGSSGCLG